MGALDGLRVIEFAGIGPVPLCGMLLADHGADVIRIDRPGGPGNLPDALSSVVDNGRRSIVVDLKREAAAEVILRLVETGDVLIEGHRPGVMERLGLGPDRCLARNPGLVYGRMTGWGQDGPLAQDAGHDINYIGLAGALHAIGVDERPIPPLNLVGDYGGGTMLLAFGVLAALFEAARSGRGQVVDAAIVDGASLLMTPIYGMLGSGTWSDRRESNLLDGAAPFYGTYRCSDGEWVAVGALEPRFYDALLDGLGLEPPADRLDETTWATWRRRVADAFATRPRPEWIEVFGGTDACVSEVLSMRQAPAHPHNIARGRFAPTGEAAMPAPAPLLSRTPGERRLDPPSPGADTDEILEELGFDGRERLELHDLGVVN